MSRNSKSARNTAQARRWSKIRKDGGHGPAQTVPKHGKRNRLPREKAKS